MYICIYVYIYIYIYIIMHKQFLFINQYIYGTAHNEQDNINLTNYNNNDLFCANTLQDQAQLELLL